MKRWQKMLAGISAALLFCVLCVGYAAINDDLNIFGFLNMKGQSNAVLDTGEEINTVLQECEDVRTIIVDSQTNQSTALQTLGMDWEDGTLVDSSDSGCVRLFYHEETHCVYILAEADATVSANPDASKMFENITTLETVWFNRFSTAAVKKYDGMFAGCENLQTVYAAEDFSVTAMESAKGMFEGCLSLSGGMGTRVYPLGAAETSQPLDATYARIDAPGIAGYFTNKSQVQLVYFRSNLLKPQSEAAQYAVKGSSVEITLSNALDSTAYSDTPVQYQLACYIPDGDGWKLSTSHYGSLDGGSYNTVKETVTVQSESDRVKVVANCLSGQMESLEAVFTFDTVPGSATWRLEDGVIFLQLTTGTQGGQYTFSWDAGIAADQSDPNQIFTAVSPGDTGCTVQLQSWSSYEFCFFVTDAAVLQELTGNEAKLAELVQFVYP